MERLHRWPDKIPRLLLVGLFLGLQGVGAMQLRFDQLPAFTRLEVQFDQPVQVKLLNFSPANKVILKLSLREGTSLSFAAMTAGQTVAPPKTSGVMGIRYIPIDEAHGLMIVDLLDKLDFKIQEEDRRIRLDIDDQQYRDPLNNLYWRGVYFQRKGDLKTALQYYRRVVFRNRSHAHAYYKAGQIRLAWKQYRLAEINFNHALRKGCDSTRIYYYMARLYRESGRIQLARSYEKKYEEIKARREESDTSRKKVKNESPMRIKLVDGSRDPQRQTAVMATDSAGVVKAGAMDPPGKDYRRKLLVFILIGSVFGLLGFSLAVLQWLRRQREKLFLKASLARQQHQRNRNPAAVNVQERKEQILQMVSRMQRSPAPPEGGEDIPERMPGASTFPEATPSFRKPSLPDEAAREEEAPHLERQKQLARELNLGVGEIELALNLSAHHHMMQRSRDYKQNILDLLARNYSIPEIARELQLGQHEVEMFLEFAAKRT